MASKEFFYWVRKFGSTVARQYTNADLKKLHPDQGWQKCKTSAEANVCADKLRKQK